MCVVVWIEVIVVLKEQLPHCRLLQSPGISVTFADYLMVSSTTSAREPALSAGAGRFIEEIRWFHFFIWECAAVCDVTRGWYRNRGSFTASVQSLYIILRHSYRLRQIYLAEIFLFKDYVVL